jgi:hypothetical protein
MEYHTVKSNAVFFEKLKINKKNKPGTQSHVQFTKFKVEYCGHTLVHFGLQPHSQLVNPGLQEHVHVVLLRVEKSGHLSPPQSFVHSVFCMHIA